MGMAALVLGWWVFGVGCSGAEFTVADADAGTAEMGKANSVGDAGAGDGATPVETAVSELPSETRMCTATCALTHEDGAHDYLVKSASCVCGASVCASACSDACAAVRAGATQNLNLSATCEACVAAAAGPLKACAMNPCGADTSCLAFTACSHAC
jgi:hypothetical protein